MKTKKVFSNQFIAAKKKTKRKKKKCKIHTTDKSVESDENIAPKEISEKNIQSTPVVQEAVKSVEDESDHVCTCNEEIYDSDYEIKVEMQTLRAKLDFEEMENRRKRLIAAFH